MKKIHIYIYSLILLFVFLPSLHIFFFYSHGIVKILISLQFLILLFQKNKIKIKNSLLLILSIYLASQTLGIINVGNLDIFFYRYKNFIFELLFFINTLMVLDGSIKYRINIFLIILITTSINLFCQLLIKVNFGLFKIFARLFFDTGVLDLISMNVERGRIYFENYNEALLPLYYFYVTKKKVPNKTISLLSMIAIWITSLMSFFRTRFLMLLSSLIFYSNIIEKKKLLIWAGIASFLILLGITTVQNTNKTIFDRFSITQENLETVNYRLRDTDEALKLGPQYILFGVGQGNYLEFFGQKDQKLSKRFSSVHYAAKTPHNILIEIFFESGLFGLISYLSLLLYFFFFDKTVFNSNQYKNEQKAYIVAFWTLLIYAFLNPTRDLFSFNCIFWFLRGKIYTYKNG